MATERMIWRRLLRRLVVAVAFLLLGGAPLRGQEFGGVAGGYFETYEFVDPEVLGIQRVSLATLPIGVQAAVIERLSLELRTAVAFGSMTRADGSEVTLSGVTDSEIRANFAVIPERLTISAAALLPTGSSRHSAEESELAGLVAADLLPFRISNWGSGGGAGLISTFTVPLGDFGIGLSAGYTMGREFEPLAEDELAYRPGDELRVRLAIDRNFGASAKATLMVGAQNYRQDELQGASIFEPGDRYEAQASFAFRAGNQSTGVAYGGIQHRGAGRLLDQGLETPAQDLFTAGVGFRLPRGMTTLMPAAELRIFRREDGTGQGHLGVVGFSAEVPSGPVMIIPSVRGRFGEALLWDGAESSVRGAEVGVGIRYRSR